MGLPFLVGVETNGQVTSHNEALVVCPWRYH